MIAYLVAASVVIVSGCSTRLVKVEKVEGRRIEDVYREVIRNDFEEFLVRGRRIQKGETNGQVRR